MHVEVSVALNFVISYLYNKLPRRRVNMFGDEVEKGLKKKFEGHWYPDMPFKGSGFRCMRVGGERMDQTLTHAAIASGLDVDEIMEYLPKELTVWIDPHEVSYRIGEKGVAKILYSNRKEEEIMDANMAADNEVQNASRGFNPEAQSFKPIDSLSSSLTNLSLSPSPNGWLNQSSTSPSHQATQNNPAGSSFQTSTSPVNSFLNRPAKTTTFTAATFAQTKFGSTKLKTQAKRPSRLSPDEMGAFIKQRNVVGPWPGGMSPLALAGGLSPTGLLAQTHPSPVRPNTLSPSDPRLDLLEAQQRMLIIQQLQQQGQMNSPLQQPGSSLSSPAGAPSINDLYNHHQHHLANSIPSPTELMSMSPMTGGMSSIPGMPGPGALGLQQSPLRQQQHTQQQQQQHSQQQQPPPKQHYQQQQQMVTPSPTDGNKAFLDSLNNWNSKVPQYNNMQHLLVAN